MDDIKQIYRKNDNFHRYLMENKDRVRTISTFYKKYRRYFGKKVLDIACGGGILGFILDKNGHSYTGIDVNPDMIKGATEYANHTKTGCKFILGNAVRRKIPGEFDTITILGNSIPHISTKGMISLLENLRQNSKKGTYLIVEYRDIVALLFNREWKDKFSHRRDDESKTYYIKTEECDTVSGAIRQSSKPRGEEPVEYNISIWSPFILEALMNASGWKLVKRDRTNRWHRSWNDIYRRVK